MKRNVWVGIFYLNTIVNAVIALRIYPNPICIFNAFVAGTSLVCALWATLEKP